MSRGRSPEEFFEVFREVQETKKQQDAEPAEKAEPTRSEKWPILTRGRARVATRFVQFRDSIRLAASSPMEMKISSLSRGQTRFCQR